MRFGHRTGLLIAGLSSAVWLAALQPWHWYMGDLVVYRGGGHALIHGLPLYAVVSGRYHLHFTYPPFAALLAAGIDVLPLALAKFALSGLTALSLLTSIRWYVRRVEQESGRFTIPLVTVAFAVAIWLEPVRATFAFGQVNAILMFLVVADVLTLDGRRSGGIGVGLAAAIKLTPLAFIPYLLLTGRVRQGLTAVTTFLLCALVGLAVAPGASKDYWLHHRFLSPHRVGRVENASNQSVRGVLARLLRSTHLPVWWVVISAAVLLAGLWLARTAHRRNRESQALIVMAVATLCASPISWSHHWVWCALMVVACVDLARRSSHLLWTTLPVAVAVPFALGLVFWPPHTAGMELRDSPLQQILSASYLLAGLLLCGLICWDLAARSQQVDDRARMRWLAVGRDCRSWRRCG